MLCLILPGTVPGCVLYSQTNSDFFGFLHFSFTWDLAFAFATTHQPLMAKRWF